MVYKLIAKLIPWKYIWEKISKTMFFVKLKAKWLDGWLKKRPEELDYKIKTVKANAFSKFTLSSEQQLDLENCKELEEIIIKWLHDPFNIETEALKVDYSQWQFSTVGFNFRKILVEVAATIKDVQYTSMTVSEKNLLNSQEHIAEKISNSLFENQEKIKQRLEDIKQDLKTNKVKTARIKILELRKLPSDNLSEETKINILELLLVCQLRLPYTVDKNDRISTLYQLSESVTEAVRKEKIQCLIQHTQQNHRAALTHINNAHNLSPEDPDVNRDKFIMLCNAEGEQSATEFLSNISPTIIEKSKIDFARCYYEINNLDKAEELLNSFHAESFPNIESCILSAEIQTRKLQNNIEKDSSISNVTEEQVQELEKRLDQLEGKLCDEEEIHVFVYNKMRGTIYSLRKDNHNTIYFLNKSFEINPNDPFVNTHLIMARRAIGDLPGALSIVNTEVTLNQNIEQNILLIETGQVDKALFNIDKLLVQPDIPKEEKVELYELKIIVLPKLLRSKQFQSIYDTLKNEYHDIQYTYKVLADIHKSKNGTEDQQAIVCLQQGIDMNSTSADANIMRRILFRLLIKSKKSEDIDAAIEIGKKIFNPVQKDDEIFRYIQLLFDTHKYEECLSLVKQIEDSQGYVLEAKRVESTILFNLREYERCVEICTEFIKRDPNEVTVIDLLVKSLFHLRKYENIADIIDTAKNYLSDNIDFLLISSEIFRQVFNTTQDLDVLNTTFNYASQAVLRSNKTQKTVDYYIRSIFSIPNQSSEHLEKQYLDLHYSLLNDYPTLFPNSTNLRKFEISNDPEEALEQLLAIHRETSGQGSEKSVFDVYNQYRLPLLFLSQIFQKDVYTAWKLTSHTTEYRLWLSNGEDVNCKSEKSHLQNKLNVVISAHSLILLQSLNLLDYLTEVFDQILISQSSFDLLKHSHDNLLKSSEDGSKFIQFIGEQIYFTQIDAETHKKELSEIEAILSFINGNCKIIGNQTLHYDKEEVSELSERLGSEATEFIFAKNTDFVYYSDDWFIRYSSSSTQGRKNMYILPFLKFLLSKSHIERRVYDESILKLVKWNYYIIPLELETIQHAIHKSNFTINIDVKVCFDLMYDPSIDIDSVVGTLLNLTKWIWAECRISNNRVILTDQILSILSARIPKTEVITLFEKHINFLVHPLNSIIQDELRTYINSYKKFAINH